MTRPYRQVARGRQTAERRRAIIEAVGRIIVKGSFDDMTLMAVAEEAGVSLKTVTRQFGTKEDLLRAAMSEARESEEAERAVVAGDLAAIASVLADRYDEMAEMIYRMGDVELRYGWLGDWVQMARSSHLQWLEEAFAPWLPAEAAEREARLMSLFWATEIRSWWALRARLGQSRDQAQHILHTQIAALVRLWEAEDART